MWGEEWKDENPQPGSGASLSAQEQAVTGRQDLIKEIHSEGPASPFSGSSSAFGSSGWRKSSISFSGT